MTARYMRDSVQDTVADIDQDLRERAHRGAGRGLCCHPRGDDH